MQGLAGSNLGFGPLPAAALDQLPSQGKTRTFTLCQQTATINQRFCEKESPAQSTVVLGVE